VSPASTKHAPELSAAQDCIAVGFTSKNKCITQASLREPVFFVESGPVWRQKAARAFSVTDAKNWDSSVID
jgi:hypothetical protein